MEIVAIVGASYVNPVISEAALPLEKSISVRHMQREMVVGTSAPPTPRISGPGRGHAISSLLRIDETGLRHHVEDGVPFNVGDRLVPLFFARMFSEAERDHGQAAVEIVDRSLDDWQTEQLGKEVLGTADI